jgi:tetratricopeptide (TPR) repeat protein
MNTPNAKRLSLIVLAFSLVLVGVSYPAYRSFVSARQTRLIKKARNYLAGLNRQSALLCLKRALQYNPRDVEACRLMADLAGASDSPAAHLYWRSRVVELNPASLEDRLALAAVAISQRDLISATNALAGVNEAGKKTFSYHNVAGSVAVAANQLSAAKTHFLEAVRLEPTNAAPQLSLAVVRLHETNSEALAQARSSLNELRADPNFRCRVLRELTLDAVRYGRTNDALSLSQELVHQTNSLFSDKLLRLDILRVAQSPEFRPTLAFCQHEVATNSTRIYDLGAWQMASTSPAETLTWLLTLPDQTRTNQPVALMVADCRARSGDWRGLQASLGMQNWAELEFIRHAFLTRALRGQELPDSAKTEWSQALRATSRRKEGLVMLLRLAANWNWESEGEEILSTIVSQYPNEKWAAEALGRLFYAGGRTRSLMTLFNQLAKSNPSDLGTRNNLAMTALLLDAQEFKPHELAREVYEKAATNSSFVSTYAFSLHLQEKDAEALKAIETLPSADLEKPSNAGYYALILAKTGNAAKARKYLGIALDLKTALLPEERKLFEKAKTGV